MPAVGGDVAAAAHDGLRGRGGEVVLFFGGRVGWFARAALAVLVMLPRLASPRFGFLDDGLTLQTGREVVGRWSSVLDLIQETGRFFPAYWLVFSAVYGIVGVRPPAFFALNVVLLAGLLML